MKPIESPSTASQESPGVVKPVNPPIKTTPGLVNPAKKEATGLVKAVPQVVDALGQISNYFGSSLAAGQPEAAKKQHGDPSEQEQRSGDITQPAQGTMDTMPLGSTEVKGESESNKGGSTAIGQLSHEAIGRLAGAIAEQLTETVDPPNNDGDVISELPSYAPEKCIAEQGDGKGSSIELSTTAGGVGGCGDDMSKLQDILVSEREIFGAPLPDESDSEGEGGGCENEDVGTVDTKDTFPHAEDDEKCSPGAMGSTLEHADEAAAGSSVGDTVLPAEKAVEKKDGGDDIMDHSSSQPLTEAEMIAEFQKLTSLNEETLKEKSKTDHYLHFAFCLILPFHLVRQCQEKRQTGE